MDFTPSERSQDYLKRVNKFIRTRITPIEEAYLHGMGSRTRSPDHTTWEVAPQIEELKAAARAEGLWNLFLPPSPEHRPAPSSWPIFPTTLMIARPRRSRTQRS